MANDPSAALNLLLEQARKDREAAREALARAQLSHQQAVAQLQQLEGFAREYEARWQGQFQGGAAVEVLRCYQDFMRRLGQAIAQQHHAVRVAQGLAERERQRLLARETRLASIEALAQRRLGRERIRATRLEQKHSDELAARALSLRATLAA